MACMRVQSHDTANFLYQYVIIPEYVSHSDDLQLLVRRLIQRLQLKLKDAAIVQYESD